MKELYVKSLLPVRLDKYLMDQFPALGMGRLNKALRENKIKLNGKKQPLSTRVQNGDIIKLFLTDDQLENRPTPAKTMADEFPDSRVYVVDSLSASLGQGLLLYLAVQKKREGLSAEELVQWVEENKLHIDHWFTVDDLNYLKMGGRVSATTAFLGTMLSIKPVMHTSDEGKLVPVSKARGRKASLQALIDKVAELGIEPSEQVMFICHADCEVEARAVAEELKARYGVKEVYINYIGPVIGSHTGPNTMGLFFVGTKR